MGEKVVDRGGWAGVKVAAYQDRNLRWAAVLDGRRRLNGRGRAGVFAVVRLVLWLREAEGCLVCARKYLDELLGKLRDFFHHDGGLNELDIFVRRIPVDVRVDYNDTLSGHAVLKIDDNGNVVLLPQPVIDVVLALGVRSSYCGLAEVNHRLLEEDVLASLEEGGATIDDLGFFFAHTLGATLWPVYALVIVIRQLFPEETMVAALVDFLQADNVGVLASDFAEKKVTTELPGECF